jgi:ADP-ribose pyrophosphatase YjhB (NUDIX family)
MKPVRCAVAAVLRHPGDERLFLAVRRPDSDEQLPGVWGLPAVTLAPGELPEAGLRRIGREKLGTEVEPVRFVGIRSRDRGDYELILMDIEARLTGPEPAVADAPTRATRYVDQRWTGDLLLLRDAARMGSVCSQVMLEAHGVDY